jgi:hypothetical protein
MLRPWNRALLLLPILIACVAGCAGTAPAPEEKELEFPDWVRIAVPEKDGRLQFVGGVAFAVNEAAGIREAIADARSQIHLSATHDFTEIFNRAIRGSGVETEAIERLDIKNSITGTYGHQMADLASQDDVYFRPCGDAAQAGPADGEAANEPVCQIFVLMSVSREEWDNGLVELLMLEKARRIEEGQDHLADYVEWMAREVTGGEPPEARKRER